MTKSECALGFAVFSHPAFSAFLKSFHASLKHEAGQYGLHPRATPEALITKIHTVDKEKLRSLLLAAAARVVEGSIPFTRYGDAIVSYGTFVMKHAREPSTGPGYLDSLYHIKTTDELLDPLRVFVSDKQHVKTYVKAVLGDGFTIPTLAILDRPDEVDAFVFPPECAIKPTQASGHRILRQENAAIDREMIKRWFAENYYHTSREVNYRQLKPRVIVEKLIHDFVELKFICRQGHVKFSKLLTYTSGKKWVNYFDRDWRPLDVVEKYDRFDGIFPRPNQYAEAVDVATRLSAEFNLVRIDCYLSGEQILVGEITNCEEGGLMNYRQPGSPEVLSRLVFS